MPVRRSTILSLPPHSAAPDPADLKAVQGWVRRAHRPTAIDLFSGAGGLSLGLQDAGFTVLVGADHDSFSVETHLANIGGLGYEGDLSDPEDFLNHLRGWGIHTVDLLAGGVPCQPFSRAGQSKIRSLVNAGERSAADPRADLWRSFIQIVQSLRPRAVLLENVPDLAVWNEGAVLLGFLESMRDLGYQTDARILDASEYGVPQHRARLFIVGLRAGDSFEWPKPSKLRATVKTAIDDLPRVAPGRRIETVRYDKPTSWLQRRMRKGIDRADRRQVFDHVTRQVRPDDAKAFRKMRQGQTYKDLPEDLQRYRTDIFTDKYKRLAWNALSRSITAHLAKDGYWYIHPSQHRTLSIREAARIQTFPDRFRFAGSQSHQFQQIGNAVPPLLGEAIGVALRKTLTSRAVSSLNTNDDGFRAALLKWHHSKKRSFPWRSEASPWQVLIAEMCLHRTRADQVVPVYERLRRIADTPRRMIENASAVRDAMQSLGLRWRIENVLAVADAVVTRFDGMVPDSEGALRSLPGVGDYVANAVRSFGFGKAAVLIDTNTERIVSRTMDHQSPRAWQVRLDLYRLAGRPGPDAEFNYALLDLGAMVCRAVKPLCEDCPVRAGCAFSRKASGVVR